MTKIYIYIHIYKQVNNHLYINSCIYKNVRLYIYIYIYIYIPSCRCSQDRTMKCTYAANPNMVFKLFFSNYKTVQAKANYL